MTTRTDSIGVPFPKPPSPQSSPLSQTSVPLPPPIEEILVVSPSTDPPPPYRAPRRVRGATNRSTRRTLQASEDSHVSVGGVSFQGDVGSNEAATETTPLIRRRTLSHSSTAAHSVQSVAQTVLSSSRTMMSLFQTEEGSPGVEVSSTNPPFEARAKRYFRPLVKRAYYSALFHLLVINLPFEIAVWVYLFVGTLTGTTLLITLPLGLILCFIDLIGARIFARVEIFLQMRFHGPLSIRPPNPPHPLFSRHRTPSRETESGIESGPNASPVRETSFLRLTYLMFTDPTSYQALFYFLVIKPGLSLLIPIAILILVPPAFVLIVPAPAVLRAIRRIGIWQAEIAIDALS